MSPVSRNVALAADSKRAAERIYAIQTDIERRKESLRQRVRMSVEDMVAIGSGLLEAREIFEAHDKNKQRASGFVRWYTENLGLRERQCQNYMRLAKHKALALKMASADASCRAVLRAIVAGRAEGVAAEERWIIQGVLAGPPPDSFDPRALARKVKEWRVKRA